MMSETITKIKQKEDKLKIRLSELDTIFDIKTDSSNNKIIKKKKN